MPRAKSGLFDNREYQNEYHRNLKKVLLSFNPNNPDDMELLEILKEQENATGFIKTLIRNSEKLQPKVYPPTRYSDTQYGCGACRHELSTGKPRFCQECGQAVDWENVK